MEFPFEKVGDCATRLIRFAYQRENFFPDTQPAISPLPEFGEGEEGLREVFEAVAAASAGLASANAAGHMDTAPHPAAAFCDALVSAVNNNLLFREISPLASGVEEMLIDDIGQRLGLTEDWFGTFVSGGSLANLTALFAATGGLAGVEDRADCCFYLPPCAHVSIAKSLAVLGIPERQIVKLPGDEQGRGDQGALIEALRQSRAKRKIIVSVLGSTVHGAVEDIAALSTISRAHDAWLHVDAIYGGALAFSHQHRYLTAGLDKADSVVAGPQKWLYVPRLSAIVWVRGKSRFDQSLGVNLPYSDSGGEHRGRWGLQGSRRADALTLWAVLRYVGTRAMGELIDNGITLCRNFHHALEADDTLYPTHKPDLNLQCFAFRDSERDIAAAHTALGSGNGPWVSLSQWGEAKCLRAVLLSPSTEQLTLEQLMSALKT